MLTGRGGLGCVKPLRQQYHAVEASMSIAVPIVVLLSPFIFLLGLDMKRAVTDGHLKILWIYTRHFHTHDNSFRGLRDRLVPTPGSACPSILKRCEKEPVEDAIDVVAQIEHITFLYGL